MEFDFSYFLLALLVAFALGWWASRLDMRQLRVETSWPRKAYFKGLNFLLNEQQDRAIDAFIEAVQNDPDTSELHFALGNLFRRRGEYERAVRVHQHLLSRADLSPDDRHRAQHALALDFLKAGLLDRAEDALNKLEGTRFEAQARLVCWPITNVRATGAQAAQIAAKRLKPADRAASIHAKAHYLCEQAQACIANHAHDQAQNYCCKAISIALSAPRPHGTGACNRRKARPTGFETLSSALDAAPAATALIAPALASYAIEAGQTATALEQLKKVYASSPAWILDAIVVLEAQGGTPTTSARDWYVRHLEREPSWWLRPSGSPTRNWNTNSFTHRCSARSTMPCNRSPATAVRPAASRPSSISGNAPAARLGTATRRAGGRALMTA